MVHILLVTITQLAEKEHTDEDQAKHELKILTTLGIHRHIVSLVDHFETDSAWGFVLELAEGGEVFDRICEKGAYSESDAANVIRQIALALAHMHAVGICHRDLKPEKCVTLPLFHASGSQAYARARRCARRAARQVR